VKEKPLKIEWSDGRQLNIANIDEDNDDALTLRM